MGAGIIDFGANSSLSACFPFDYELAFDNQFPGNTYTIEWGDGTDTLITYPNLPTLPNTLNHAYNPSCNGLGQATPYTISVSSLNSCINDTTNNDQGPFYISTATEASFTANPSLTICQNQSITFNNTSSSGFNISSSNCSVSSAFQWQVNQSSSSSGTGYSVIGAMGDIYNNIPPISGNNQIVVNFTSPGTYSVTLEIANTDCGSDIETKTVTVLPIAIIPNTSYSICSGSSFSYNPTTGN